MTEKFEPAKYKDTYIKELKKLVEAKNIGVLITDHNVRETLSLCDRSYILAGGKVLAEGKSDEIAMNENVKKNSKFRAGM